MGKRYNEIDYLSIAKILLKEAPTLLGKYVQRYLAVDKKQR